MKLRMKLAYTWEKSDMTIYKDDQTGHFFIDIQKVEQVESIFEELK